MSLPRQLLCIFLSGLRGAVGEDLGSHTGVSVAGFGELWVCILMEQPALRGAAQSLISWMHRALSPPTGCRTPQDPAGGWGAPGAAGAGGAGAPTPGWDGMGGAWSCPDM